MAEENDIFNAIIYIDGLARDTPTGIVFESTDHPPRNFKFRKNVKLEQMKRRILRKVGADGRKQVSELYYLWIDSQTNNYGMSFVRIPLLDDEDLEAMVSAHRQSSCSGRLQPKAAARNIH